MTRANDTQIGGKHYKKSSYEHWDWAINVGLDYLASAASKYVLRYRDKNGAEDLLKARHYLLKLKEVAPLVLTRLEHTRPYIGYIQTETALFIKQNNLDHWQAMVCGTLATWTMREQLDRAIYAINVMHDEITGTSLHAVDKAKPEKRDTVATANTSVQCSPAPLEDSNKHAERYKE